MLVAFICWAWVMSTREMVAALEAVRQRQQAAAEKGQVEGQQDEGASGGNGAKDSGRGKARRR